MDARNVNFSDSIAAKRKSYRSKNWRRQRRADGVEEVGDLSDGETESVERKLARLRREVEELKDEMVTRDGDASKETAAEQGSGGDDGVQELSRALDHLYASRNAAGPHSAAAMLSRKLGGDTTTTPAGPAGTSPAPAAGSESTEKDKTKTAAETPTSMGVLSHAAAFDSRLALIEAAMGITNASNPFIADGTSDAPLQPVLPSLDYLTSRLSALTNVLVGPAPASAVPTMGSAPPATTVSTPNLEALSARVRKLTQDTEALAAARKRALDDAKTAHAHNARLSSTTANTAADPATASDGLSTSSSSATEVDPVANQRDEQATKIQALYATLPTIQSLHPLLPSVLERLRSLRAIHAGAAQAAESLDEVERRQAEMNREVEAWRDGLKTVEEKMEQGEKAMKGNIELVEPWVRDLETRLGKLG